MKTKRILFAGLTTSMLSFSVSGAAEAATIWAPMWDVRQHPMTWEVLAAESQITFHSYFQEQGRFSILDASGAVLGTVAGSGDQVFSVDVTSGEIYQMRFDAGFHVRPHWEGIDWARLGPGRQGVGPDGAVGFQSDAELGFDDRWDDLPSQFSDVTWYYNVGVGEQLAISVEQVVGDAAGLDKFDWISPTNATTLADADGLPGSGFDHYPARGGDLNAAPNPNSIYWQEYEAPVDGQSGFWGFKLTADEVVFPAWHYILDRTDQGADQYHYLLSDSILDPTEPEPEPASVPEPAAIFGLCALVGVGMTTLQRQKS